MEKKLLLLIFLGCAFLTYAQPTFTSDGGNNLFNYGGNNDGEPCTVDMNGDCLDDVVRMDGPTIHIDYQQADGSFTHQQHVTTSSSGLWSMCAGDIDNNGYNDLLLGDGDHVEFVYANNDGTAYTTDYKDVYIFSQRSTLSDIDNDGHLDAFICHDVDQSHPYRNDGTGNLTLDQSLIVTADLPGNYAAIWTDYDNDGDNDLYVTKCRQGSSSGDISRTNLLYRCNGDGTFSEVGVAAGIADNEQSWSTVVADFDNDGDMDFFVVNHTDQNRFYDNNGDGTFTDIIGTTGINATDLGAWESSAVDINNDGWIDIYSQVGAGFYMNNGDGTFTDGSAPNTTGALGDLNNDGFIDIMANTSNDRIIYFNDGNSNNWLKVGLIGVASNRSGIGARLELQSNGMTQIREVRSGESFSMMHSLNAHFGIGSAATIDVLTIYWPSGTIDVFNNLPPNQLLKVIEGSSGGTVGCTDPNAHNYDPNATVDNGSCMTCTDGMMNGDETNVDCGGSLCAPCLTGCTDPNAHNYDPNATLDDGSCMTCTDGMMNGDETDVDCGGSLCAACPVPGCTDPNAHNYDPNATVDDGSCMTCMDGIMNGDETDVDCGGSLCVACPTCVDGIMNGDETGIDCGGSCPDTCPISYCDANGNNNSEEWIASVEIGSINNASGAGSSGYEDFTGMSTDLVQGSSNAVNLAPGYSGNNWDEYFRIWIDFNQNGSFDDAGELAFDAGGTVTAPTSGTLVVPADAMIGTTRMRVVMKYVGGNNNQALPEACGSFSFGEVEDYTVNITGVCPMPDINSFCVRPTVCGTFPVVVDWASMPGAIAYEFHGSRSCGGVECAPSLNRTVTNSGFNVPGSVPNNFPVLVQLRAQCAGGIWSDWTPLTTYIISSAACATCAPPAAAGPVSALETIDISALFKVVNVYPNPVKDILNVEILSNEGAVFIQVYDVFGRQLKTIHSNGDETIQLDISDLSSGQYFIDIKTESLQTSQKFVKL